MNTEFDFSYLKVAREQLGLTQKEAANASGISQRDISQLESGLKKFFPLAYILFLNVNGVNLNILFSNTLNIQNLIPNRLGKIRSIDAESIQFNYSIFKIVRERAGFTQKQASERSGLSQRDISQLEAGLKKFIPFQFIQYLSLIKADLNEVFKYESTAISPIRTNSTISPTTPKKPDFSTQNRAPENRIFDNQLTIDTDYSRLKASEISPEITLKVDGVSIKSSNELTAPTIDFKPEPKEPSKPAVNPSTEKTPLPSSTRKTVAGNGIALVKTIGGKSYIDQIDQASYINSLPVVSIPGLETGMFRAFEISGREMEPLFFEGDIALGLKTDDLQTIKNNRLYIIVSEKRIIIRRIINCIKASNELILLTDNESVANEVIKADSIKEAWEFSVKITSSVDQLKNSFNELYFQLLKIQKDLDLIKSKL
ncbi:helix-turn-helix domain-containing protein [Solitalea sp. MAHUQ-68]|uniref:Helix-turn-helix domain-containing protein n=1 Tax=Solitalea agri TaxID=2953739 RepID=A0A9X2JDH7_9SPHI|nr:helix-turn-helix domain-containing protein [Solitalea agri]MCO4291416.1 helix-turn-helix domain-containing protein [Solitalea agri]